MKAGFARVLCAQVQRLPSPHFTVDHVLSADDIQQIVAHWPSGALFPEDDEGSGYRVLRFEAPGTWQIFTPEQKEFWTDFVYGLCTQIVQATFALYAPVIAAKFGDSLTTVDLATVSLTEFEHDAVRAGVHVHNDEATWLFTNLIHVDDNGATDRGNAMYGFPGQGGLNDQDAMLRRLATTHPGMGPEQEMVVHAKFPFNPGRMFSFCETPLSYHGSEVVDRGKYHGRRKMIRMHARAPAELAHLAYGVSAEEYRKERNSLQADPRVVAWMKADVQRFMDVPTFELNADALEYAGRVEFLGVHGGRRPRYEGSPNSQNVQSGGVRSRLRNGLARVRAAVG